MSTSAGDPTEGAAVRTAHRDEFGHASGEAPPLDPTPYEYPGGSADDRLVEEVTRAALSGVFDPEIGIDIVSLGLIYGAVLDPEGLLTIDMTLTSPYCPMGGLIQSQADAVCRDLPGVRDVHVNLVWTPPWDPRVMASDEAKLELGIY